jgi:hypothetical protein
MPPCECGFSGESRRFAFFNRAVKGVSAGPAQISCVGAGVSALPRSDDMIGIGPQIAPGRYPSARWLRKLGRPQPVCNLDLPALPTHRCGSAGIIYKRLTGA